MDDALAYIARGWDKLTLTTAQADDASHTLIELKQPFVVPATGTDNFAFKEQFYWDSYFTSLGLTVSGRVALAEGMLENLLSIYRRFGVIPNASRYYFLSRSQPPLLTSYIFEIYDKGQKSVTWLNRRLAVAKDEYWHVWLGETHPHWRQVYRGLSRYYDINVLHDLAEAESGWDMTPRFSRRALDFLPVDLNCFLYKYETDFAHGAELTGDKKEAAYWRTRATKRRAVMNEVFWHSRKKFFFDYDFVNQRCGKVWSLAAYAALWSGVATADQAAALVEQVDKFFHDGGLTTTTRQFMSSELFGSVKTQWAYPNGWAPLHWLVAEGLRRYGYDTEAKEIVHAWLHTTTAWFASHGEFLEKYNVVRPDKPPVSGVYPTQKGFGWTNALYVRMVHDYGQP